MVKLDIATLSNKGGREKNQDYAWGRQSLGVYQFVIADGLGGQGGGEIASKEASRKVLIKSDIEKLRKDNCQNFFSPKWVNSKFNEAHNHIKRLQQEKGHNLSQMATTMVMLLIKNDKAIWGHIGDSRLYLFRKGKVYHQTKDHSIPQMLLSTEEIKESEMRNHPDRNRLLRAIGENNDTIKAHIDNEDILLEGDVFLLCTDGFWEYVLEKEMLKELYKMSNARKWLQILEHDYLLPKVENERITKGTTKANNDNYSAIAIWYGNKPSSIVGSLENKENIKQRYRKTFAQQVKEIKEDFTKFKQEKLSPFFKGIIEKKRKK